jgi:hypothetical protein
MKPEPLSKGRPHETQTQKRVHRDVTESRGMWENLRKVLEKEKGRERYN